MGVEMASTLFLIITLIIIIVIKTIMTDGWELPLCKDHLVMRLRHEILKLNPQSVPLRFLWREWIS